MDRTIERALQETFSFRCHFGALSVGVRVVSRVECVWGGEALYVAAHTLVGSHSEHARHVRSTSHASAKSLALSVDPTFECQLSRKRFTSFHLSVKRASRKRASWLKC
jgi:hypothetical protein